jgi:hypothetical protein
LDNIIVDFLETPAAQNRRSIAYKNIDSFVEGGENLK